MTTPSVSPSPSPSDVDGLIRSLSDAVSAPDSESICAAIKTVLERFTRGDGVLDERWFKPVPGSYGRRLLYRDPQDRFTAVVMSWGPGQGTPIHDHDGLWCVECVCRGRIRVKSYDLVAELGDDKVQFTPEGEVIAGVGEAGALIPPFEYHVIENPFEEAAATLHVYGGEMDRCNVFHPAEGEADGVYQRVQRDLEYTFSQS